jgi:large subunit ribosomal protein L4
MENQEKVTELNWPVVDFDGKKIAEIALPADLFGIKPNEYVVQRAVRVDLSNRRVATAHTLTRDIVHGSNRKPWAQKHTGRARAGTTNSPLWRHGGVVFGPNGQQSYKLKMNKKEHYLAFCSVLSDKALTKDLIILDDSKAFPSAKTKDFVKALAAIGGDEKKNLIVLSNPDENFIRAAKNLPNVVLTTADNLSVYDILNANKLILEKGVLPEAHDEDEEDKECK